MPVAGTSNASGLSMIIKDSLCIAEAYARLLFTSRGLHPLRKLPVPRILFIYLIWILHGRCSRSQTGFSYLPLAVSLHLSNTTTTSISTSSTSITSTNPFQINAAAHFAAPLELQLHNSSDGDQVCFVMLSGGSRRAKTAVQLSRGTLALAYLCSSSHDH